MPAELVLHKSSTPPADFNLISKQTERCVDRVRVWMESNKLKLNEEKTEAVGARSFEHQAPLVWNSLPLKIRLCSSLSSFKFKLRL